MDPAPIKQMANAYWASQALYVAAKLRIFTVLGNKGMTLKELAASINMPLGSIEKLLNACCALRLLEKENGRYRNSPLSEEFLVEGKEPYLGYMIFLMGQLYAKWGRLLDAVENDKPVSERFGEGEKISEEDARSFTLAMHSNSLMTAPVLAAAVDLSANKRLLDIGGGSGINSVILAEKNPRLEAVIYDFPAVIKVAREIITKSTVADRVKTQAGDFTKGDLPKGFDCILLSHILHGEGEKGSRVLLKKCFRVLEPEGRIIITDFVLNEAKDGPVFPALFALNMLVETAEGATFSGGEVSQFLEESGFTVDEIKPLGKSPVTVITATKPG